MDVKIATATAALTLGLIAPTAAQGWTQKQTKTVDHAATTEASTTGQWQKLNLVENYIYVWNFWNTSTPVGVGNDAPQGVKLQGVSWEHQAITNNNNYPGELQVLVCSKTPERCFDVTAYPSAWTDAFNDLDAKTTSFTMRYRWYNRNHPEGPNYDALIGATVKPFVKGAMAAWWGYPAATSNRKTTGAQSLLHAHPPVKLR